MKLDLTKFKVYFIITFYFYQFSDQLYLAINFSLTDPVWARHSACTTCQWTDILTSKYDERTEKTWEGYSGEAGTDRCSINGNWTAKENE